MACFRIKNKFFYLCALKTQKGALAQLARALDWQSKGQGFDSPTLHKTRTINKLCGFFYLSQQKM
jgi:hypothetical protein